MKSMILVALALVAVAIAAPPHESLIVRSNNDQQPDGAFQYGFETDQGIQVQAQGDLKDVVDEDKKPHTVVVFRGSYSYINEEGKTETINYYADENGFHAEGDSIPKAPVARR